jgi:hypothetical protein
MANTGDSMALYTRSEMPRNKYGGHGQFVKKDRPLCNHCGITGHIVDKCYKLHGFPPGYKSRRNTHAAKQVSVLGEPLPHLPITQAQCQQLLAMLSSQTPLSSAPSTLPSQITPSISEASPSTPHQATTVTCQFISGIFHPFSSHFTPKHSIFFVQPLYSSFLSQNEWIVDT